MLSTFLSVCGTWIYRLRPALHAHLPCTTLLNSEECALSEKKEEEEAFTELFARFDYGVINNVDDGLLILLVVTCDQQRALSDL